MQTKSSLRKGLAVGIILLFVGISIIPSSAQNRENTSLPTSRGHWLYVGGNGPGNYSTIQDAIDDASDGDTIFVYDDSSPYNRAIIDKAVTLIGENKETTLIENQVVVEHNNVTVTGFTIHFLNADGANNYTIINNEFHGDEYGLYIHAGSNVKIINNTIIDQKLCGIEFHTGSDNIITGNSIIATNNSWSNHEDLFIYWVHHTIISNNSFISLRDGLNVGISICDSENNTIENNSFVKTGIRLLGSYENTFSKNSVNGKPLLWLEEEANKTVDDAGQVFLLHCNQITVCNLTLFDVPEGITLYDTNSSNIQNNTFSWCGTGINLDSSNMNNLSQNTVMNCSSGISIGYSWGGMPSFPSNMNILSQNIVMNCSSGIGLDYSNMDTLSQNILINCSTGITIGHGSQNTIERNSIQKGDCGIDVHSGPNNITHNNVKDFSLHGISISGVRNTVRENNFLKNSPHTYIEFAFFDEGYHTQWLHNYWGRPRYLPYKINGYIYDFLFYTTVIHIPWINFDWHPAKEPYDIS